MGPLLGASGLEEVQEAKHEEGGHEVVLLPMQGWEGRMRSP